MALARSREDGLSLDAPDPLSPFNLAECREDFEFDVKMMTLMLTEKPDVATLLRIEKLGHQWLQFWSVWATGEDRAKYQRALFQAEWLMGDIYDRAVVQRIDQQMEKGEWPPKNE
jgi:hypothetical protein